MLERLKNLFIKRQKEQSVEDYIESIETRLSYCIDDDGNIFIDVALKDFNEKTILNFSELIAALSSIDLHIETINAIKNGFIQSGKPELYDAFLEYTTANISQNMNEGNQKEEQPCIKPSDML